MNENKLIRVMLLASSPALRAGLRSMLSMDKEIKVIDEASEWSDSPIKSEEEADVVITISASFASAREEETNESPKEAILFLTDEPLTVPRMKRLGNVWGALPLDTSAEELSAAIHALSEGLIVGTRPLLFGQDEEAISQGPLTDRESEVLGLLAKGLANKQIALSLGISEHTVKFHVSSIYGKLNATNRTQAVREGVRNGWITL